MLFDLNWYVQLCSPDDENLQIAFVAKDHPSVPVEYRKPPSGVFITVEVDNVDNIYKKAIDLDLTITKEKCDEEWGQRHFFVVDPSGLPVDVFQVIACIGVNKPYPALKESSIIDIEGGKGCLVNT